MKPQKILRNGERVWFRKGNFDHFYVVVTDANNKTLYAPKDKEMFEDLLKVADRVGKESLWHFVLGMATCVTRYSRVYDFSVPDCFSGEEVLFSYMVGAMIAEENMATAVLGKKMKLLGTYQVLMEGMDPELAANFSKGKPWRELEAECKKRGI